MQNKNTYIMAKESTKPKHFVLVHGVCHGAWCWYKIKSRLQSIGHKVTALDLAGCGISTKTIEQVQTFSEYSEPLLKLLESLDQNEKVVLVGHSFGGFSVALAMDKFPQKIAVGVFLAALVPDTLHKPTYVIEKYAERYKKDEGTSDTEVSSCGGKTVLLVGPNNMASRLYQLCSKEDLELAKLLVRRGSTFSEELSEAEKFSKEGYGSVARAYIVCSEDMATNVEFQKWMIHNAGIHEVHQIKGADHMAMLSKPQQLCSSLLDIADKHA